MWGNPFFCIKNCLFGLLMALLLIPGLQKQLEMVKEAPLFGAFAKQSGSEKIPFAWSEWLNGDYQTKVNQQIEDNIGFRNSLVRFYNQWQFSLYNKANAEGVLIGKQNECYEEDYLRAATGAFYLGEEMWEQKAKQLKCLNDTLQKLGKNMMIVIEPGKGTVVPGKFPAKYAHLATGNDNYHAMLRQFKQNGIPLLDLNEAFRLWADTSAYDLFPKTGTHWSYYGATLAADSLFSRLELLYPAQIGRFTISEITPARELRHPDDDIWLTMNLIADPPLGNVAYPKIRFNEKPANAPKVLIVGDSFFFNWQSDQLVQNAFSDYNFWYYNKLIYNYMGVETAQLKDLDFATSALDHDLILIMITERFHQNFAWGFDTQLYEHFFPGQLSRKDFFANEARIGNLEFIRIYNDAIAKGMPLAERLEKEAAYRMFDDWQKHPDLYTEKREVIEIIETAIQGSPAWYRQVAAKAAKQKKNVAEMLRLDAEWVYNQKLEEKN